MIYYGHQNINNDDIRAVENVLKSPFLTQGPIVEKFEQCVANYCGAKYAVAVTNATSALHIACLAAGLGSGDALWTSPITFVASANCARYCGADVDFVDIDPRTYNMSVTALEEKLRQAKRKGKLPKIVVPVHFAGQPCDMQRIQELSEMYGFRILEDASHAVGAEYLGGKVGSCNFSDMAVFSFHPVKIITTGEGGMILTNRKDIYDKLRMYRSHGIVRDSTLMSQDNGAWYYEQIELGYNYRMTDIQAALGCSQMQRIDQFVKKRNNLSSRYQKLLADLPLDVPYVEDNIKSSWHIYVVRIHFEKAGKNKVHFFNEMKSRGICLNVHYIPVHLQPYYQTLGFRKGDFPLSEQYYQEAVTLPLYYDLQESDQDEIVRCLKECLV